MKRGRIIRLLLHQYTVAARARTVQSLLDINKQTTRRKRQGMPREVSFIKRQSYRTCRLLYKLPVSCSATKHIRLFDPTSRFPFVFIYFHTIFVMDKRQLIGSATRYIAGRNAVQTVYWRKTGEDGKGLMKTTKMTFFGKNEGANKVDAADMFAKVRERYT